MQLYREETDPALDGYRTHLVRVDDDDLSPVPPSGRGWEMCGSAATKTTLYWFWEAREK